MVASFLASPVRAKRGLHVDELHMLYASADPPALQLLRHHQARPSSMLHHCSTDAGVPVHTVFSSRVRLLRAARCFVDALRPLNGACEERLVCVARVSRV